MPHVPPPTTHQQVQTILFDVLPTLSPEERAAMVQSLGRDVKLHKKYPSVRKDLLEAAMMTQGLFSGGDTDATAKRLGRLFTDLYLKTKRRMPLDDRLTVLASFYEVHHKHALGIVTRAIQRALDEDAQARSHIDLFFIRANSREFKKSFLRKYLSPETAIKIRDFFVQELLSFMASNRGRRRLRLAQVQQLADARRMAQWAMTIAPPRATDDRIDAFRRDRRQLVQSAVSELQACANRFDRRVGVAPLTQYRDLIRKNVLEEPLRHRLMQRMHKAHKASTASAV